MIFKLAAVVDDDTRKSIREMVLGEAKTIARNVIDSTIKEEVKRLGADIAARLTNPGHDWRIRGILTEIVQNIFRADWGDIKPNFEQMVHDAVQGRLAKLIDTMAQQQVDAAVAKKMATKTVWEAASQDAYVRQVVRSELRTMLK